MRYLKRILKERDFVHAGNGDYINMIRRQSASYFVLFLHLFVIIFASVASSMFMLADWKLYV